MFYISSSSLSNRENFRKPSKTNFLRSSVLNSQPNINTVDSAQLANDNDSNQHKTNMAHDKHSLMDERMQCVAGDMIADDDPWRWSETCTSTHPSILERRHSIACPRPTFILPSLAMKAMQSTSLLAQRRVSLVHSSTTQTVNTAQPQVGTPNASTKAALAKRRAKLPAPFLTDMGRGLVFFSLCVLYSVTLLFVARFVNVPLVGRLVALGMHAIESGVQKQSRKTGSRQIAAMQVLNWLTFHFLNQIQLLY